MWQYRTPGIPDELFERVEEVPITKEEVRVVQVSKGRLSAGNVVYDVGCGSGSVSVEASYQIGPTGKVFSIDIDPKAMYTIVTIDYLVNVGGERYGVLREGKNTRPLNITLRDALMEYVKSETAAGRDVKPNLDGRFVLDRANSVISADAPPQ